jgi:hypothetical protein
MLLALFRPVAYALLAFTSAAILVVLTRRFRQRHLWDVPGPSNPSFVWGDRPVSEMIRIVY